MPEGREGVAVLLGFADHRLVPGGIIIGLHRCRIKPAELLEPVAPAAALSSLEIARPASIRRPVLASIRSVKSSRLHPSAARGRARFGNRRSRRGPRATGHRK